MYGLLLFLKCFHWITADRVDYVGGVFCWPKGHHLTYYSAGPSPTSWTSLSVPSTSYDCHLHTRRRRFRPHGLLPRIYRRRWGFGDGLVRLGVCHSFDVDQWDPLEVCAAVKLMMDVTADLEKGMRLDWQI